MVGAPSMKGREPHITLRAVPSGLSDRLALVVRAIGGSAFAGHAIAGCMFAVLMLGASPRTSADHSEPCYSISDHQFVCATAEGGCYEWSFVMTSAADFAARYVLVPQTPVPNSPITLGPAVIELLAQDGSLLQRGGSTRVTLQVCNGRTGDYLCPSFSLAGASWPSGQESCAGDSFKACVNLPPCDCGQVLSVFTRDAACTSDGSRGGRGAGNGEGAGDGTDTLVSFTACFEVKNLTGRPVESATFASFSSRAAYLDHTERFDEPIPPGGSAPVCVPITGATPGEQFCFYVLLQQVGAQCCCSTAHCLRVPDCPPPLACDFNADGAVNGADLGQLLAAWGACAACAEDLTSDGQVDGQDLGMLLAKWTV